MAAHARFSIARFLRLIDELHAHKISATGALHSALQVLAKDPTVRLPQHELTAYLKRYAGD